MDYPSTLNEILKKYPEYGDLPIVVSRQDGGIDYLSGAGSFYTFFDDEENTSVLCFAPN